MKNNLKLILPILISLIEISIYFFLIASCFITMHAVLSVLLYYNVLTVNMSIIHLLSFTAVSFGVVVNYLLAVISDLYLLMLIIPNRHREVINIIKNKFRKY